MNKIPNFEELKSDFEVYGIQIPSTDYIEAKCLKLCDKYNLSSERLAVSWLGFAATNSIEEVTDEGLEVFEKELMKQKCKTPKEENKDVDEDEDRFPTTKALTTVDNDLLAVYGVSSNTCVVGSVKTKKENDYVPPQWSIDDRELDFTPSLDETKSFTLSNSSQSQQSHSYSQRVNRGAIVTSFGKDVDVTDWKADFSNPPEVTQVPCGGKRPLTAPYNFMFEKLRDIAEVLDDSMYFLGKHILSASKIEETTPLRLISNEPTWCLGRICCDSVGKLNAASVLLEGDQENNAGNTVCLDLSKMKNNSIFPGQVVAVKGTNVTGDTIVAEEIISGNILPSPNRNLFFKSEKIQVRIACGPFTTLENLSYEPLMDLLEDVALRPPHILILVGPLLGISHPCLDDPSLTDTYDFIVEKCIKKIASALRGCGTSVYIVASSRDVGCIPVYPTPPMLISGAIFDSNKINLVPDPSLLDIDGLTVGLTSVDYPMQMSREELSLSSQNSDRLARLSRHMLLQQSFYPLYPPSEDFNFSIEQADLHTRLPFTPHIIVTPSDLKGYVKTVDGCVFINPGRLTKGKTGGSYCKVEMKKAGDQNPDINVQIIKI